MYTSYNKLKKARDIIPLRKNNIKLCIKLHIYTQVVVITHNKEIEV